MTTHGHHPHEAPFRYDEALVSSCASSSLLRSVLGRSPRRRGREVGEKRGHNDERDFYYDGGKDCHALFERHAAHFERPTLGVEEKRFWDSWTEEGETSLNGAAGGSLDGISPRTEAFLRSVDFVHRHNNAGGGHRVALNRFSDVPPGHLPLMPRSSGIGGDASSSSSDGFEPLEAAMQNLLPSFENSDWGKGEPRGLDEPAFVPLDDDEMIMKFGEEMRLTKRREYGKESNSGNLSATPTGNEILGSSWWWIGGGHDDDRGHDNDKHLRNHVGDAQNNAGSNPVSRHNSRNRPSKPGKMNDDSYLLDAENERVGLNENDGDDGGSDSVDDWEGRLDWATDENPDGVPVVHSAMDQGMCGSCWAISALGTLEASIARNMAYSAYEEAFSSVSSSHGRGTGGKDRSVDPHKFAVLAAQLVERQSIRTADLSVQELVDCDTRYDQGCAGGNPLLAFYFLHRFGVTSSGNYPYTGTMNACDYRKVDQPVASVATWGILTPDHENNMEKVLRFIGPVAVGMIGADPAFLAYSGGVFRSSKGGKCDLGQADHAMLITGYGEEVSNDGTVEKYWIARNSWGSGWGENGYVRMARLGGKKGHRGVCGIARSPSVALGGMFTKDVKLEKNDLYGSPRSRETTDTGGNGNGRPDDTAIARASSQIKSFVHRIRTRLGFVQKGIVMSMNNGSENRDTGIVIHCAMAIGMMALFLLLAQAHRTRHHGCRRGGVRREQSNEEESIATNWSMVGVHNGVHESVYRGSCSQISSDDGERMHLLANSNGSLYT